MLGANEAMATVAVRNLESARKFYEGTLGLATARHDQPSVISYKAGRGTILVYESQFAGTNQATAVTWIVPGDVDAEVKSLKARGVTFEHYDMPGAKLEGDVHVMGELRAAWFKDPDGNIHSVIKG